MKFWTPSVLEDDDVRCCIIIIQGGSEVNNSDRCSSLPPSPRLNAWLMTGTERERARERVSFMLLSMFQVRFFLKSEVSETENHSSAVSVIVCQDVRCKPLIHPHGLWPSVVLFDAIISRCSTILTYRSVCLCFIHRPAFAWDINQFRGLKTEYFI